MIPLKEFILTESAAKNVHQPRKGSTIYLLKKGDTKAISVKVENVQKISSSWYVDHGYDVHITLAANTYGLTKIINNHYSDAKYNDENYQVITQATEQGVYYIGTSKEAIKQFINSKAENNLSYVLTKIEKLENELAELNKEKDKLEGEINMEITESLK